MKSRNYGTKGKKLTYNNHNERYNKRSKEATQKKEGIQGESPDLYYGILTPTLY